MRGMAALSLLLCAAHAEPTDPCVLTSNPPGVEHAADTGIAELDKRIESERGFLAALFGVEPELVLFTAGAPRRAFAVVRKDGTAAVYLSRARLRELWKGDHRVAAVAAVLAHVYAHVLQCKLGSVPVHSCVEHADLLVGWYLGKRNIATLQDGEDLDAAFASVFATYNEFLATPFGRIERQAETLRRGFDLFRCKRIGLDRMCREGLDLFPPEPFVPDIEEPAPGARTVDRRAW